MSTVRQPWHMTVVRAARGRWVSLAVLIVVVTLLVSAPYLTGAYSVGLMTEALIIGLWAMSLNVLAGQTGLITLGHAATLGVGGYAVGLLQRDLEWPFLLAGAGGVAAAMAISVVFALTAARSTRVYFILVTLAQGMLVWGVIQRWSSFTGGDDGLRGISRPDALIEYWAWYWFVLAVVLTSLLALKVIESSRVGLRFRGVRESPTRMAALGYSVSKERIRSFCVSGLFAGIAGALYAGNFMFIAPGAVYVTRSVEGLLMVILGGINTFLGPMVGAAALVFGRATVTLYTERWHTVLGLVLIAVVLFGPDGLVGWFNRVVARVRNSAVSTKARDRQPDHERAAEADDGAPRQRGEASAQPGVSVDTGKEPQDG